MKILKYKGTKKKKKTPNFKDQQYILVQNLSNSLVVIKSFIICHIN